jgi:hypothetical protein
VFAGGGAPAGGGLYDFNRSRARLSTNGPVTDHPDFLSGSNVRDKHHAMVGPGKSQAAVHEFFYGK